MNRLARMLRHLCCTTTGTRTAFPQSVLADIEATIGRAEAQHAGEIRFAVETALPLPALWHRLSARQRAVDVFARLGVWDTSENNGVLIYVLRADRAVEIIADRGISARVSEAEWASVCREVEAHFARRHFAEGARAAVDGVARLLARHFPAVGQHSNELPNQPILL